MIGAGTLILEKKFIRGLGTAAHIEDIVVKPGYRGKNLGLRLISLLKEIGDANGCYKVILDCDSKNVAFYEKVSNSKLSCDCIRSAVSRPKVLRWHGTERRCENQSLFIQNRFKFLGERLSLLLNLVA